MSPPLEALEAALLNLPSADRARLLDRLIVSLDADRAVEEAWMQEAKRRDDEIESGAVQAIPGEEVLAGLRATLR
jgi:putative addiction module component (TIGR02574 family)